MTEFDRLRGAIDWIDLSFVERERTPGWAIQVGIRCHIEGMSIRDAGQFIDELGVNRSHVAVHNWVHKAELQPVSTVTADQLAVDEKMIRLHGQEFWLYGAVDPETNEILHVRLFPTTTKQTTRWLMAELHRRYQLDGVRFLVDDADYLAPVLEEDGYRFQVISHGNRNAIECVFREVERERLRLRIFLAMSSWRQLSHGSKLPPSTTIHAKVNATTTRLQSRPVNPFSVSNTRSDDHEGF